MLPLQRFVWLGAWGRGAWGSRRYDKRAFVFTLYSIWQVLHRAFRWATYNAGEPVISMSEPAEQSRAHVASPNLCVL